MANPTYPGVYVEEVSSGVRPIAAASTSTAAFVGVTERGPKEIPTRITGWSEYIKKFGSFFEGSRLAESVYMFFNNGGSQCYIMRVLRKTGYATASVTIQNRDTSGAPVDSFVIQAKNEGAWGNELYLQISESTKYKEDRFKLVVWKQAKPEIIPQVAHRLLGHEEYQGDVMLEEYDNLNMNPESSHYAVSVINGRSDYINVIDPHGSPSDDTSLQQGRWISGLGVDPTGGGIGTRKQFRINLDNDGWKEVELDIADGLEDLDAICTEIQRVVSEELEPTIGSHEAAYEGFTCQKMTTAEGEDYLVLTSGSTANPQSSVRVASAADLTQDVAGFLKLLPADKATFSDAFALRRPAIADPVAVGDAKVEGVVMNATPGSDGEGEPDAGDIATKLPTFDPVDDFSLLAIPGRGTDVIDVGMNYCEGRPLKDVFFIGEAQDTDDVSEVEALRDGITSPNSYGAVYYPWIMADDPSGRESEPVALPPSGFIAGLYARIDGSRGVWKAPAGIEAQIKGANSLSYILTDVKNGVLNDAQIACIRQFPGAGIVSWGARTITSDPEYNYIPVRRTAIMLRVSIYRGIQWAVFEPNNEDLWAQLRMNIKAFMMTLFRRGAFKGTSPGEAFFVKCDAETTTSEDINLGIVNVLIGFAPLKPAEFVIVKISQKAAGSS